ncbi:NTP transferase domain-containing protein [Dactylosporangium sp. NPDC005572]|uniref:molybdenum cofactor guanylyltransferase n=1 Tax=Dactylosporangium sp. NPDC005572 TaxID=3156889 RepID=UPI0033AC498D
MVGGEVLAAGGGLPAAGGGLGVAGSAGGEALAVGGGGEVFAAGDGGAGGGLAVAGGETNVADGGEVLPSSGGEVLPAGGGGEVFAAGDGVARGGLAVAGGETGVAGGGAEGEAGARGEVALVGGVGRWDGRVRPGAHVRVRTVQEEPAGGGPVAGLGAGLAALVEPVDVVLVLAADLPRLDGVAVQRLVGAVGGYDGALFVDQDGRRQLLCGAWRIGVLQQALQRIGSLDGVAMRRLVDGLAINDVRWDESGIPPYFDCDTDEDLRRVHE